MSALHQRVRDLMAEADALEYGVERLSKAEEAVRIADEAGDDLAGFAARLAFIEAANYGGWPERGLVAFGWCVGKVDREPDRFVETYTLPGWGTLPTSLLWVYKWMTLQVPWYPQLTRAQIDQTFADMEARYRRHELSLRPIHMLRANYAMECDADPTIAKAHFDKYQWSPRDRFADCSACELDFDVNVSIYRGEHERAFRQAAPLLDGRKSCAEVPDGTYGDLLASALALGWNDRARELHRAGIALIDGHRDFLEAISQHLEYLVKIGELDEAHGIFERNLGHAATTRIPKFALAHWAVARDLYAALAARGANVALRAPKELRFDGEPRDLAAVSAFFADAARTIAARFDARNGNDVVSRRYGVS